MSAGLNEQLWIFLLMLVYGAVASGIFDILRSIYRIFKPSALTVGIGDILFWLVISVLTFFAIFISNNGQIRLFEFFAMILGSIIYFLTLSKAVIFMFSAVFFCLKKIFIFFLKFFLTIARFLYKMVLRVFVGIFMPVFKLIKKIRAWLWLVCFRFKKRAGAIFKAKRRAKKMSKQKRERRLMHAKEKE